MNLRISVLANDDLRSFIELIRVFESAFKMDAFTRGFERVFVQADGTDGYALDFYRKTGPAAEDAVVHFSYKC